jgi:hypothetical protein
LPDVTDAITDLPCPPWCANGEQHLLDHLRRRSDFHHCGQVVEVPTTETTPQLEPIEARVYLDQQEQIDEHGISYRHPVEIVVQVEGGFLPDDAVRLASVLNDLARVAKSAQDSR